MYPPHLAVQQEPPNGAFKEALLVKELKEAGAVSDLLRGRARARGIGDTK